MTVANRTDAGQRSQSEQTGSSEATEQPISTKTRIIIETLSEFGHQLEDVTQTVREIKQMLKGNATLKTAIIRAVKQLLSHIDPDWDK